MPFLQRDATLLFKHLQAIIEVELFTIPLYLTASNSLRSSTPSGDPAWALQTLATSVAVQEMYHLQQACNITNAFNVPPIIPKLAIPAGQKILVPHLDPGNQQFYVQLGNLPDTIKAMIEIETPDESGQPVTPNVEVTYQSIGDLYNATMQLLSEYWATFENVPAQLDPHFTPNHKQVGYGAFPSRFRFNEIAKRTDVMQSVNAITDQGEGHTVAPAASSNSYAFQYGSDGKVAEPYQGSQSDRFYTQDLYTHYYRFLEIQKGLGPTPQAAFYQGNGDVSPDLPSWAAPLQTIQDALTTIWSYLLDILQAGFTAGNLPENNPTQPKLPGFNSAMVSFKYLLPMIWQYGACPSFLYREGVTAQDVQDAMDAVDPWCLFHWDATTAQLRVDHPDQLNTCQGLNDCAGLGWGGLGTQAADGACATADTHTCVGSNACNRQGGCGFLSDDANNQPLPLAEQWVPAFNTGASTGGCQSPIATRQVFHKYDPNPFPSLVPLEGTSVWDRARSLMAQKLGVTQLPTPVSKQVGAVNYDGDQRRANTTPSSTS